MLIEIRPKAQHEFVWHVETGPLSLEWRISHLRSVQRTIVCLYKHKKRHSQMYILMHMRLAFNEVSRQDDELPFDEKNGGVDR